jgi:hypothetical protein
MPLLADLPNPLAHSPHAFLPVLPAPSEPPTNARLEPRFDNPIFKPFYRFGGLRA